jgi:hypothetical protein
MVPQAISHAQEELMIDTDTHLVPPTSAPRRHNRSWYLEKVAMALIAIGALMMFQPFVLVLFTYSFDVILLGVILFTIFSRKAN